MEMEMIEMEIEMVRADHFHLEMEMVWEHTDNNNDVNRTLSASYVDFVHF